MMTNQELARLLRTYDQWERDAAERSVEPATSPPDCLEFSRVRAVVLNPDRRTDAERQHVADCRRCRQLVEIMERDLEHPSFPELLRWQRRTLPAEQARIVGNHVEVDECRLCRGRLTQIEASMNESRSSALEHGFVSGQRNTTSPSSAPQYTRKSVFAAAACAVLSISALTLLVLMLISAKSAQAQSEIRFDNEKRARIEAQTKLDRLSLLLDDVRIDKAIDERGPALFPAGRDRIGVHEMIDPRYIRRVRWRYGADAGFEVLYAGPESPPLEQVPMSIAAQSPPLLLDGRVVTAELQIEPYAHIEDSQLARLIPPELRQQSREFLLAPTGIAVDPRPIDVARDVELHSIVADGDDQSVNRYFLTGRVNHFREGMNAFLVVDPTATDEVWVTAPLEPDSNGNFGVRAFLGDGSRPATALDRQLYRVFVVLTPHADTLDPGDRIRKPVEWSEMGCIVGPARIKRNDGMDGFADSPFLGGGGERKTGIHEQHERIVTR